MKNKFLGILVLFLSLVSCTEDNDAEKNGIQITKDDVNIQLVKTDFSVVDIDFIDKNNGFVIDTKGSILSTENSGANWKLLYESDYELLDIQFLSKKTGYVLAKANHRQSYFLLKTSDYGKSFQKTAIPNGTDLTRVFFINDNVGFVLGKHILRTADNGLNWTEPNLDFNVWSDILKRSNDELYVCGLRGAFLKSTNQGKDWEKIDLGINSHLYKIQSFGDYFYFLGQTFGRTNISKTKEYELLASVFNFHIYEVNIIVGFGKQYSTEGCFSEGAMFISNNGGKNWETTTFSEFGIIRNIDFTDLKNGFCVGGGKLGKITILK